MNLWTYATYDKLSAGLLVFGGIVEYFLGLGGFSSHLGIGHGVCHGHFGGVIPSIASTVLMINKQKVKDEIVIGIATKM